MTRPAAAHELVKGAVIRVPTAPGVYWSRPFGLEVTCREPDSKATGAITLHGWVLAQDGTTARKRRPTRTIVVTPGSGPQVTMIRKAAPPEFTAKIATLVRVIPPLDLAPDPDPVEITPSRLFTTRWCVVSDETGEPLPGEGTGPAVADGHVLAGDWDGKPTPWLAREGQPHRDPIDQCIDRVRQERGILRVGENLVYDLSAWPHSSAQELVETGPGLKGWRDTYACKRCQRQLKWLGRSPWVAAADDGDEECHGEVWVP